MKDLNINYRRSIRAKYLRITVDSTPAVTVTVPVNTSLKRAKEFAESKQAWIYKHLTKVQQRKSLEKIQPQLSTEQLNEIQKRIFSRLENFSDTYNLSYSKAAFRCQKTRWGSCSSQYNISLNINIALLPEHLQDYILLHELCHIRHKNHSKSFWSQLDEYSNGKARELAKELKQYGMNIRRY